MKTKRIFYIIFLAIIVLMLLLLFTFSLISFNNDNKYIKELECSLSDLNIAIDILQIWNHNYKYDSLLGNKVKRLIIAKILLLRSVNPDLKNIKWDQLDSIYRIIIFVKKNDLSINQDGYLGSLVSEYLLSVEDDVKKNIKDQRE